MRVVHFIKFCLKIKTLIVFSVPVAKDKHECIMSFDHIGTGKLNCIYTSQTCKKVPMFLVSWNGHSKCSSNMRYFRHIKKPRFCSNNMELYVFQSQRSKFVTKLLKNKQTKCLIGLSASNGVKNYSHNGEMAIGHTVCIIWIKYWVFEWLWGNIYLQWI